MSITDEQRIERRNWIGASDIAGILGCDPYNSPLHVYLSKVHDTEDIEGNDAIDFGNLFELPLLAWAGKKLGYELIYNVRTIDPGGRPFASNHDALVLGKPIGLEAKVRTYKPEEFGREEGSDILPPRILLQCQQQIHTGELAEVHVPVWLPSYGRMKPQLFRVERSEGLIAYLIEKGMEFWEQHVIPRIPPPAEFGELEIIKRIKRQPEKLVSVSDALVIEWELAKKAVKAAEKEKDRKWADLLAAVGDGDAWEWGEDGAHYTYYEYPRHTLDSKALKRDHPEIFEVYGKETRYRTPYRRSEKKGK